MRRAASDNLKKSKKQGLWEDIKGLYSNIVKPYGSDPRPARSGHKYTNTQLVKIEEDEIKPLKKSESTTVYWPGGSARPRFKSTSPREIARQRREGK